jgi:hypothetical protein
VLGNSRGGDDEQADQRDENGNGNGNVDTPGGRWPFDNALPNPHPQCPSDHIPLAARLRMLP